jgi:hypothetical protein
MGDTPDRVRGPETLAETVRTACIRVALEAYEQAGISGLCHEGRFEAAIGALRRLDVGAVISAADGA